MGALGAPGAPGSKLLEAYYIERLEIPGGSLDSIYIRNLLATRTYYLSTYFSIPVIK
jgi:hypothetical protein